MAAADPNNAILGLWIPVVVFAHLFAAAWLLKTFMLGRGNLLARKQNQTRKSVELAHGGGPGGAAVAPAGVVAVGTDAAAAAAGRGVPGTPSASPDLEREVDQEKSPFTEQQSYKSAMDDDAIGGEDDVPDASPLACATLRQHLSVAPETFTMEWQEMGCSYNVGGTTKVVLADIWGKARPGEMQALMGPSGAGKSTFMDILAMRKSVGNITGVLLLSGRPATRSFIRKTAYVPQEDNFVPTMTTKETLDFYSQVILPSKWSKAKRNERVHEVLEAVGLGHAHKTLVGGSLPGGLMMRGLSGGERKRLSIAAGILAAPAVLFLDEPTSGLDSFAALSVMGHLQRMARAADHIVISTIHQPRVAIWQMFETVTLLAGGRLMYHGARDELTGWFASIGYVHDPSRDGVPSDWCLDLVAVGFAKPAKFYGHTMRSRDDLLAASRAFMEHYARDCAPTRATLGGASTASHEASGADAGKGIADRVRSAISQQPSVRDMQHDKAAHYASGPVRQFVSLLSREFVLITRNPFDVAGRALTFTWVAILIGLLYYSMPLDSTSVRTRLNLCYVSLCFVVLMPYISMGLYTSDKKFYLADASAQLYRPLAYYLAKVVVTLPFQIICCLCFSWTLYGMAGMRHGGVFIAKFGCIVTLVYLIAVQVLHCCAILAPNQDTAFMLSLVWTTFQLLLSTFFVVFSEVTFNYWLTQLRYISAVYFGFEALTLNEFQGVTYDCSRAGVGGDFAMYINTALPTYQHDPQLRVALNRLGKEQPGCMLDPQAIFNYFQFGRPYAHSAAILTGYLLIMHVATFFAMKLSARHEAR